MSFYYDVPTQVVFTDSDGNTNGGIAFQDFIICACCGSVLYNGDIVNIIELPWISLEDELIGD